MSTNQINKTSQAIERELLLDISRIMESSLDIEEISNPVLESITTHLRAKFATLTIFNRKTNEVQIEAAIGLTTKQTEQGRYKIGEGVTGKVAESGNPAIIAKVSASPLFLNRTERIVGDDEEHSFICVPVKTGTGVIGTLSIDQLYREDGDLETDAEILQIVASMIAHSVEIRRHAQENNVKLTEENTRLRKALQDKFRPANIIGNSAEMQIVYDQIAQVSKSPTSVLVLGDTGTGKELIAAALHYNSDRAEKAFVKAHCAALPENIIESELFGHVKGAFTGATSDRKGRFELANGGTLFLDEIGEIPPSIQIKLLRVIQEKEFERVGDTKTIKVNVRLIAATNRDLQTMAAEGSFREDLYYRLNVFPYFCSSAGETSQRHIAARRSLPGKVLKGRWQGHYPHFQRGDRYAPFVSLAGQRPRIGKHYRTRRVTCRRRCRAPAPPASVPANRSSRRNRTQRVA